MMPRRLLPLLALAAFAATAQKYEGPRPPKPDMLYIKHANELVPTEYLIAAEEGKKDSSTTYVIAGASSPVVTPLASPIFLMQADKLVPERLQLFKLESKNGRREITMSTRKPGRPIRMEITRLTPDRIWRIEVDESLDPGEYSISPAGGEGAPEGENANQVFCFQVK
jgi:hypothetical protein